ncbi:hypothetical protein LXL04_012457 [Taraxacum kok-saghyz]
MTQKDRFFNFNRRFGLILETVCAAGVTWVMGQRYAETAKIMPVGVVAGMSDVKNVVNDDSIYGDYLSSFVAHLWTRVGRNRDIDFLEHKQMATQAFVLKYLLFFPHKLAKAVPNTPSKSISRRLEENQESMSNIFNSLTEETKSSATIATLRIIYHNNIEGKDEKSKYEMVVALVPPLGGRGFDYAGSQIMRYTPVFPSQGFLGEECRVRSASEALKPLNGKLGRLGCCCYLFGEGSNPRSLGRMAYCPIGCHCPLHQAAVQKKIAEFGSLMG